MQGVRLLSSNYIMVRILILLVISSLGAYGQNHKNNWILSPDAIVDFSSEFPQVRYDSLLNIITLSESNMTISDSIGSIILFTDNNSILNKNFQALPNGSNIGGNISSYQGVVGVHNPSEPNLYHLFYVSPDLRHVIIDLNEDEGLGDVIYNEVIYNSVTEQITAYPNPCGGVWIICHERGRTNNFLSFLLKDNVMDVPIISSVGTSYTNQNRTWAGIIRISPDGRTIVATNYHELLEFYNFDVITGLVSSPYTFSNQQELQNLSKYYIGDFSRNSRFFYTFKIDEISDSVLFLQLDLNELDMGAVKETIVGSKKSLDPTQSSGRIGINRGPDGKIYSAFESGSDFASVEYPDLQGIECGFNPVSFTLKEIDYLTFYVSKRDLVFACLVLYSNEIIFSDFIPRDTSICINDSISIDLSMYEGVFQWSDSIVGPQRNFKNEGEYILTYTTVEGCTHRDTMDITFLEEQIILADTILCFGERIIIGEDTIRDPGIFIDTLKDENGCLLITELTVEVDSSGLKYDTTRISISEGSDYEWNGEIYSSPGLYIDEKINDNGCMVVEYLELQVEREEPSDIVLSNILSANDDGINDVLSIYAESEAEYTVRTFQIYSRWGNVVHRQSGPIALRDLTWDGKINDEVLPSGVYTYVMIYKRQDSLEEEVKTGTITLIR
jgi:gliding motility-associated-like protein